MQKIINLIGISGSGKSTYARKLQKENTNSIIVGRDKIRELLFGYTEETVNELYARPDRKNCEDGVTKVFNTIVHEHLKRDCSTVIIDNTNLSEKSLNDIKKEFNYVDEFEYYLIKCSPEVAIDRDSKRNRQVGKEIIMKQYDQLMKFTKSDFIVENFILQNDNEFPSNSIHNFKEKNVIIPIYKNPDFPGCYIFDIDGTLAEKGNRNPYDESQVLNDTVIDEVRNVLLRLVDKEFIVFVTGRSENCREDTVKWIGDNFGRLLHQYIPLHMRKENDTRPDWQIKEEIWREISEIYRIESIFDDRLQVIRRANKLGLFVFNVNQKNVNF